MSRPLPFPSPMGAPVIGVAPNKALVLLCVVVYVLFCLQQVVLARWIGEGLSLGAMSIRLFAAGISLWMFWRQRVPSQLRLPLLGIGACLAALAASVAASEHTLIAFKYATRYATALMVLWAFLNLAIAFPAFARAAAMAALIALWINLLLGIGVLSGNDSLRAASLAFHAEATFKYLPRVSGFYEHPAILGATGIIVALLIAHAYARRETARLALALAGGGALCALLLSAARNALVPVLLLAAWQLWRGRRQRRFSSWPYVLAVIVMLGALGIASWTRYAEITSAVHENPLTRFSLGRTYLWEGALDAWRTHPWFGLGAGVFQFLTPDYTGGRFNRGELHAHNLPLGILSETGLAGLAACGLLLWALWRPLLRRTRSAAERTWSGAWLVTLLGFGIFDFYLPFYGFSIHCALVVAWLYTIDAGGAQKREPD